MTTQLTADDVMDAKFAKTTISMSKVDELSIEATIREYLPNMMDNPQKEFEVALETFNRGQALLKQYKVVESESFRVGADISGRYINQFKAQYTIVSPIITVFGGYTGTMEKSCYIALAIRGR